MACTPATDPLTHETLTPVTFPRCQLEPHHRVLRQPEGDGQLVRPLEGSDRGQRRNGHHCRDIHRGDYIITLHRIEVASYCTIIT